MKRILMLCLAGALVLAAASCKDEEVVTVQTICVNGLIREVKTAVYAEEPADAEDEAAFELGLFPMEFTTLPEEEPDFYITIDMSESLWGKTIDLSKPLDRSKFPGPYLSITAKNGSDRITIDYDDDPISEKISCGSLSVTKNGDRFAVELSVTLSDGQYISAGWKGAAKKAEISE